MVREMIAGVVLEDGSTETGKRAVIFDDDTWCNFYSSQKLNEATFIDLTGIYALYRSMRETAVCYNA